MDKLKTYGQHLNAALQVTDALVSGLLFILLQAYLKHEPPRIGVAVVVFVLTLVSMRSVGLYHSWRITSVNYELHYILRGCLKLYAFLICGIYLLKLPKEFTTTATVLWILALPVVLGAGRVLLRAGLRFFRQKGYNTRKAVIAGTGELADRLAALIDANPWAGTELVGVFDDAGARPPPGRALAGDLNALPAYARVQGVDIVYIVLPSHQKDKMEQLLARLADTTLSIDFVPDIFTLQLIMGASIIYFGDLPIITLRETPLQGVHSLVKRAEDLILACFFLLLALPAMAVIALTIKFNSSGSVFFKQWRYGYSGSPIQIYKFRTMTVTEDGYTFQAATKSDPRITALGAWLRRYSLDELPQLINVLQGRMSLVGPRPHTVAMNEAHRKLIPGYMLRHKVKPGLTGLAQVNGCRGEVDSLATMRCRIEYDLEYVRHWSVMIDLRILWQTIFRKSWIAD